MRTTTSVEIDRPIEEVFDYTINKVSEWSITVVEDEVIEETPEGIGTTFRMVTEDRGRRMDFEGVVTKMDRPHLNAVRMTNKSFDIEAEYVFEDLGGRTRVTETAEVFPKGFFKVMFFLIGWMMKKSTCDALQKELDSLKEKLESGAGQVDAAAAAEAAPAG